MEFIEIAIHFFQFDYKLKVECGIKWISVVIGAVFLISNR